VIADRLEIRPQEGPQTAFLSTSADIAVYGGAAGGGKTWALLAEPLRHVHNPRFGAVFFRRELPQITNEGGAWDESIELYPHAGAAPRSTSHEWHFASGACISFRHLQYESDKLAWQGSQVCLFLFDELTHFSESQFFYMFSRNRSTCGVRPYIRCSTNPDSTSWVKRFLAPWVDKKYPNPARSGEIRWFVRVDGKLRWVPEGTPDAKSVTFVRSSVYDNKILLRKNPEYVGNLKAMQAVDRARLLDGDWDVKREGLVYPTFSRCVVPHFQTPFGDRFGGMDWGFHNPFAALGATLDHDDILWVYFERYGGQQALSQHAQFLLKDDRLWFGDPAGADQIAEMRRAGFRIVPCVHKGTKPLMSGIDQVSERIRTGRLRVSDRCVNLIEESLNYAYDPDKTKEEPIDAFNHALGALRYMIVGMDRGRAVQAKDPATEVNREREEEAARKEAEAEWARPDNPAFWE